MSTSPAPDLRVAAAQIGARVDRRLVGAVRWRKRCRSLVLQEPVACHRGSALPDVRLVALSCSIRTSAAAVARRRASSADLLEVVVARATRRRVAQLVALAQQVAAPFTLRPSFTRCVGASVTVVIGICTARGAVALVRFVKAHLNHRQHVLVPCTHPLVHSVPHDHVSSTPTISVHCTSKSQNHTCSCSLGVPRRQLLVGASVGLSLVTPSGTWQSRTCSAS